MKSIAVLGANAMRLAADQYNDSTAFVAILQENDLTDYRIIDPVAANTAAPALAGDLSILLPPTEGIRLGSFVYSGSTSIAVVVGVTDNREVQATNFCSCPRSNDLVPVIASHVTSDRVLPPQGDILSTMVSISPELTDMIPVGSPLLFVPGDQLVVSLPDFVSTSDNGKPT